MTWLEGSFGLWSRRHEADERSISRMLRAAIFCVMLVAVAQISAPPTLAADMAPGEWVSGHASRARLVPGPLLTSGEHIVGE